MVYELPEFTDTWGPSEASIPTSLKDIPYAPFLKSDKVSRVADWYAPEESSAQEPRRKRTNERLQNPSTSFVNDVLGSSVFTYVHDEDESYSVIDRSGGGSGGGAANIGPAHLLKKSSQQYSNNSASSNSGGGGGGGGGNAWGRKNQNIKNAPSAAQAKLIQKAKTIKRPAVWAEKIVIEKVDPSEWTLVESYPMIAFGKLLSEPVEAVDFKECGSLPFYDRQFDRVSAKTEKPLKSESRSLANIGSWQDATLKKIKSSESHQVFSTAMVLAVLMTASRSVMEWDIVIRKSTDKETGKCKIWFDNRKNSPLDLCTVSETSTEPVTDILGDKEHVCSPESFALEATMVQKRFIDSVVLKTQKPFEMQEKGPQEGQGYRYRKFSWQSSEEEGIDMYVRGDFNAALSSGATTSYINLFALTEFIPVDPNTGLLKQSYVDWRSKIDQQRGAILVTELKNNAWKLARWTIQSWLSGSSQMKLGFVARSSPMNPQRGYGILGMQFYQPAEFAQQLNLDFENAWGILKSWVEVVMKLEDGVYVIHKTEHAHEIKLYKVDDTTTIPGFAA